MNPKARILVVDDDAAVRGALSKLLGRQGYEVASAVDGREGLEYLRTGQWHVVILDEDMPGMKGDEVLETIAREKLKGSVIVFSTFANEAQETKFRKLGAAALVNKGVDLTALLDIVKQEIGRLNL